MEAIKVEWKEPGASGSASCVALDKSFTSYSLSFPGCLGAVQRGRGPRPDDGSHDWPREGTCPLKVSQRRRGKDWALVLLTSQPGGCSSDDPGDLGLRCEPWALETQGGGSAGPEGPEPSDARVQLPSTPSLAHPQGRSKDSSVKTPAGRRQ